MPRSHRRLATIAATGTLAGLATLAAAGSASAATTADQAATSSTAANGTICVVSQAEVPIAVESGACTTIVVREGVLSELLNDLL